MDRRIIGEASNYQEVIEVFRQRFAELKLTREGADALIGLQSGYCGKLLSIQPARCFGRVSLGPMLTGSAMKILFVEDPEALARYSKQFTDSQSPLRSVAKPDVVTIEFSRKKLKRIGRIGGKRTAENLTAKQRSNRARRAARALWRKRKRHAKPGPRRARSPKHHIASGAL